MMKNAVIMFGVATIGLGAGILAAPVAAAEPCINVPYVPVCIPVGPQDGGQPDGPDSPNQTPNFRGSDPGGDAGG